MNAANTGLAIVDTVADCIVLMWQMCPAQFDSRNHTGVGCAPSLHNLWARNVRWQAIAYVAQDLKEKAPLRAKFGLRDEWVLPFEVPAPLSLNLPSHNHMVA